MTVIGDIYERDVHDGHVWRHERRKVLDATDQCVFYQILYEEELEGTTAGGGYEHDETKDQHQATMKEWRCWVKQARKID